MAFNKEKIQLFWIPFIGLTAPKANSDRHCGEGCKHIIPGANIAGLTSVVNFHVFQWTPCHQTLGSFSPLAMPLGLLTRTELSD